MNDEKLDLILKEMRGMKEQLEGTNTQVGGLQTQVEETNARVKGLEAQVEENTQILKAIHHRQEETDAKLEGLSLDFAKLYGEVVSIKSDVSQLLEDQKSIHEIVGEHEVSIRSLRRKSV